MGRGINKVILLGSVGRIDVKEGITKITNISLATNEKWKDKNGESQTKTEWHNIVCFSKLAEIAASYVSKGALLYIEGKLQTNKWEDKATGQPRSSVCIVAETLQIILNRDGAKKEEDDTKDDMLVTDIPF